MSYNERFRGTGVAVVTPFRDGKIDFPALTTVLNHVINGRVEHIVCLGTTGEATSLDQKRNKFSSRSYDQNSGWQSPYYFRTFWMQQYG